MFIAAEPSSGERFAKAFSAAGNRAKELYDRSLDTEKAKSMGIDIDFQDPDLRQKAFELSFGKKQKALEQGSDTQAYETIKRLYGKDSADLYASASEGGKTAIINNLIERENSQDFERTLNDQRESSGIDATSKPGLASKTAHQGIGTELNPEIPPVGVKDYDKGLTRNQRVKRQDARYNTNLPLYQESVTRLRAEENAKNDFDVLASLSPQISDWERLNINPQTGDLILPALASPESQEYVKTINNRTRDLKATYGSVISNFDAAQFMRRLPTLANSEEGRDRILRQLRLINEIDIARETEIQKVIDEHGGIRMIDFDKAQSMADKRIEKRVNALRKDLTSNEHRLNSLYRDEVSAFKKSTPKGLVAIEYNGQLGHVPEGELKKAIDSGAKPL